MHYQYHPYVLTVIASACVSLFLGIYTLKRRQNVKGSKGFMLSMFVVTIWSLGNALEMCSFDFPTKLFWANVQYFAYCYSPVTLLNMCMEFTELDRCVANKKVIWFAVLPTIIIILVWTDPFHGLIRYDMQMDYSGIFPVIAKKYGPIFYIHTLYSHFLNIFAWVLLIRAVFIRNTIYRKQAAALLVGISLIIVPNILFILGYSPVRRFDLTPIFFAPAGIIIAWAIFRYKMFDIVPLAWASVIKIMEAGVMVLDVKNRVLDINPAFAKLADINDFSVSTKQVEEVCTRLPELIHYCTNPSTNPNEFSRSENGQTKVYEAWLSLLTDKRGNSIGRLVIIYDITPKKRIQQECLKQQRKLAITEERERLARDLHDNLAQVLGFINFQTEGIRQELLNARVEIAGAEFDKLMEATHMAHENIREYIRQARNVGYMNKNFVDVLWKDIEDFEKQTGLKVELDIPLGFTGQKLKSQVCINLLNIIKEALSNIRKHSDTTDVRISMNIEGELLIVSVEDNGKGFDIQKLVKDKKCGFGLNIMRERAWEIDSQIEIKSSEGKGTRIVLWVPLGEEERENARKSYASR